MTKKSQTDIMHEGGYVTSAEAAEAAGVAHVGTIHRMITRGELRGSFTGQAWYVELKSMLELYANAAPILTRVKALQKRVAPKKRAEAAE
jgi:hypothetical protein